MQAQHRLVSILQRIRQDVATLLGKEAINAACREEQYSWKDRLLIPVNTAQSGWHFRGLRVALVLAPGDETGRDVVEL